MNFAKLTRYLNSIPELHIPGCECVVYKDHKKVYRHISGTADLEGTMPLTEEAVYRIHSCTKISTCTAAMQLVERGLMSIDDPVSKYIPEFADVVVQDGDGVRPAKKTMLIRHLMSMQGGLDYGMNDPAVLAVAEEKEGHASTLDIVRALAKRPLRFEPGTHYLYSLCHDVLAGVVEVVSGQTFGEYLQENIYGPLGMTETTFHPTEEFAARIVPCYSFEGAQPPKVSVAAPRKSLSDKYESGGGGLYSTVNSYILLLDALANGGVGANGARILKSETIDIMRTSQLGPDSLYDFWQDPNNRGYGYALGFRTMLYPERIAAKSPVGEFGWGGAAGAYAVIDPKNHLAIYYAQHVMNCGVAFSNIQPTIRNLVYEALEEA